MNVRGIQYMGNSKLVYSTESGRICPSCGNPTATCACKKKKVKKKQQGYPNDGIIRIRREVKGRKGKTITALFGVPLEDTELKQFAKTLKNLCGTGGTIKDGVIMIQGDHRETILREIKKQGHTVKLSGG